MRRKILTSTSIGYAEAFFSEDPQQTLLTLKENLLKALYDL